MNPRFLAPSLSVFYILKKRLNLPGVWSLGQLFHKRGTGRNMNGQVLFASKSKVRPNRLGGFINLIIKKRHAALASKNFGAGCCCWLAARLSQTEREQNPDFRFLPWGSETSEATEAEKKRWALSFYFSLIQGMILSQTSDINSRTLFHRLGILCA